MSDLADSFEGVIDSWVEQNLFTGDKFNQASARDLVIGAELAGIKIPGDGQERLHHMGLSVARVAHAKNWELERYPFEPSTP